MLYMTCPTCSKLLGSVVKVYEDKKTEICANPKLTQEDREKEISKLIQSLKFKRYCCNMRLMTYKDITYDIIPVKQDK